MNKVPLKLETQMEVQCANTKAKVHIMLIKEQNLHKEVWGKTCPYIFSSSGHGRRRILGVFVTAAEIKQIKESIVITS